MSILYGSTTAEFNDRKRAPVEVTAKTRKRCRVCGKMVEVGERAILTDDRVAVTNISQNHGGAMYNAVRGAWHLTHKACGEGAK